MDTLNKASDEKAVPPRSFDIMRTLEEYAADLRAVIEKLRRKLN